MCVCLSVCVSQCVCVCDYTLPIQCMYGRQVPVNMLFCVYVCVFSQPCISVCKMAMRGLFHKRQNSFPFVSHLISPNNPCDAHADIVFKTHNLCDPRFSISLNNAAARMLAIKDL